MSIQHFNFKYLYIFLIFFISLEAKSEILKDINIEGNQRIPDETIIMFGNVNIQDNLNLNEIDKILKNIYNSNFFEDVQVTLENNVLNIYVKEKPIIQNVEYEGIKSKTILAEIKSKRILKPKSSFDKNLLQKDRSNLLKTLKNIGYFFPSVENLVEDTGNENLNLIYKIDLGSKSKIKKISFVGDKVYKDKKLKNIIISEEYKFWKFISGRKFLNENLIEFDQRLLKNFYLNKGYYQVEIRDAYSSILDKENFVLTYNINAGKKFYFNNLDLDLPTDFDKDKFKDLEKVFVKLKGKKYNFSQGVVVRNKKIVFIEGKGGTKKMLEKSRSKKLRNHGVLVKLPKKKQDIRLDLPTVGLKTFKQSKIAGLKGIVVKSKQHVFLDKSKCINFANKNKMFISVK